VSSRRDAHAAKADVVFASANNFLDVADTVQVASRTLLGTGIELALPVGGVRLRLEVKNPREMGGRGWGGPGGVRRPTSNVNFAG